MPFADYVESVLAQTIKKLVVTRRSIRKAFEDLIITDEVFNEIGPAINSAAVDLLLRLPRQRQDERRRADHAAHGRHHLHPVRGRGERADHQGVRPDPAHAIVEDEQTQDATETRPASAAATTTSGSSA